LDYLIDTNKRNGPEESMTDTARPRIMVIGGSSGIGIAVARVALRDGAAVVIVGRRAGRLRRAAEALGSPASLATLVADITDEAQVRSMFEQAGPLSHVVVTAADITGYQPIRELVLADARATIESKLLAALLIAKHLPTAMPEGSLTFTGGIATDRPMPGGAVVAAVNSSLSGLARALALELAPIRVNVLSPGWVDTPVWETIAGQRKDAMLAGMAERLPVGRVGEPEDIGEAALFVTRARHVTGTVLHVDGGQRLV
jgi:NAD(P)-dependent dehydrogenase (short-subunit alcohol dehydrogenase family)